MKKTIHLIPLLLLAALLLQEASAAAQSRKERLAEHVCFFASDSLHGRAAGTADAAKARDYIVARYKECGLQPFFGGDFVLPFEKDGKHYANVVGIIEGNELKDEYIVLGAHFDHLGIKKGEIYPGADDNASGSAALIEIARELCANRGSLKRSVIIAGFDAEEIGLYGSTELAGFLDALVGIENIKLMMSVDMVGWYGRNKKLTLEGVATIKDGRRLAAKDAAAFNLNVRAKDFENSVMTATDTEGFAKKKVPTLAVSTGLHPSYHKPSDTPEKIDYDGLDRISGYLSKFALDAASDPQFAASGRVARKHRDSAPVFEGGVLASIGGASLRFPSAEVRTDPRMNYNAGLAGRLNFGRAALQLEAVYEMSNARFPSIYAPLGKPQNYTQRAVTVPAYLLLRSNGSTNSAFVGFGGFYRYAFNRQFGEEELEGVGFNPHQAGLAAVFGVQVSGLLLQWEFRWQLNSAVTGGIDARLNSGSYLTLGWLF